VLLPPGTRVVLRVAIAGARSAYPVGAVATIVQAPADPTHAYRIRLADGFEASASREEFVRLADAKQPIPISPLDDRELRSSVAYVCVVGSRAYGLDHADSDWDRRGFYLPDADRHWSLFGVPEQLEDDARQECFWEAQKFCVLAAKANPNVLECLWTPLVEFAAPIAQDLLAMRTAFLSRLVYQTYNGYALSQFAKLQQRARRGEQPRPKHMMHLVRLLRAGIVILREGRVPVHVGEALPELLAIRDGAMAWPELDALRRRLHAEFDDSYAATRLPERPDHAAIDAWLIRARRSMVR
jgi:predicted nucleotidyltransferase